MVEQFIIEQLKEYTFRITIYLFLSIFSIFILSLIIHYIRKAISKLKSKKAQRYYSIIYDFILDKIRLKELQKKKLKKTILTDVFVKIISIIVGEKQLKLKNAVKELELIEVIEKGLHSILPSKRVKACYLLGLLGMKEHSRLLIPALRDYNPRVISSAIIALGEIRDINTVPEIISILPFCLEAHAWLISAVLPFFGPDIYEFIKPYLKANILHERKLILLIKVVSNLRIAHSIRDLENIYLNTESLDVKIAALNAIGKINDVISIKIVFNALNDKTWEIRAVAANIVGSMSLKGASSRLIPLLNDKSWYVRRNAANALAKMGKLGIYTLLNYMNQKDKFARDMIAQTLEETGVVDKALVDIQSEDPKIKKDAEYIIKMLIQHGYVKYLENYKNQIPHVDELIEKKEKIRI
ncbi:MAG: hypothetical protein DRP84_05985 [Spirochaetes bacterium]|nr:MAG: hypothetical protein DRP84_05985 [Spirochaetota bacterium]